MKVLFACGGTAGHINPAVAVAGRIAELEPESEFLFVGAEGKMEMELVPKEGYEIKPLKITNIMRGKSLKAVKHNMNTAKNVLASKKKAKEIIRGFGPDVVVGTGGYVCYPVLKAASELRIHTAVHESNAVPGLTTKMLAGCVDRVMVGFEESAAHYKKPEKVVVTGTPVRGAFSSYTKEEAKKELGLDPEKPLVVSVWGSLGSGHMNEVVTQMVPAMKEKNYHFIHSTGKMYYDRVMKKLEENGGVPENSNVEIRQYIFDMPRIMCAADLILCRAGASTLAELTYLGKPVIIVPSPNVTNNHQEKNARVLEAAGGAKVFLEGQFDGEMLLQTIDEMLSDPEKLSEMSAAMRSLSADDATERISGIILDLRK